MIDVKEAIKDFETDVSVVIPKAYFLLMAQTLASCQSLVDAFIRIKPEASTIEFLYDLSEAIETAGESTLEVIRQHSSKELYELFLNGGLEDALEQEEKNTKQ